jgi:hypothetical protein
MIKYNYENILIIILIIGITWVMFLNYEQKNIEGLRRRSNRFCNRCRTGYTNNSGLSDYCKAKFYNDYTSNSVVNSDYISKYDVNNNYILNSDGSYIKRIQYDKLNNSVINEKQKIDDIKNNILFYKDGDPDSPPLKTHILTEPIITNDNGGSSISFDSNKKIIYFGDNPFDDNSQDKAPTCLQITNYKNFTLKQGNESNMYNFSNYSNKICDLSLNKGPYFIDF